MPYAFTGASAAATLRILGSHDEVTMYVNASILHLKRMADELGLLRFTNTTGSVKLLHAQDDFCFYGTHRIDQANIVHPIQIYLDLYATLGPDHAATFREALLGVGNSRRLNQPPAPITSGITLDKLR